MALYLRKNGTLKKISGLTESHNALTTIYNPASSGLESTNVQDAIDEVYGKAQHGIFELWVNPSPNELFDAQSIEISSDIQYDAFIIVTGAVAIAAIAPIWHEIEASIASINLRDFYMSLANGVYATMSSMTRQVSQAYNSSTHKYTFTFGNCTMVQQVVNSSGAITSTSNGSLSPMRILGIIHND